MRLKKLLLIVLVLFVPGAAQAGESINAAVQVPSARDLNRDGALARERQLPILVMFSSSTCHYCRIVEEEFLKPMIISGEYEDKVLIRRLEIDAYDKIRRFDGRTLGADAFAHAESVTLVPTLKFYDDAGRELAPKMVGVNTVEMYGGYLDAAIERSLELMRGRANGRLAQRSALTVR